VPWSWELGSEQPRERLHVDQAVLPGGQPPAGTSQAASRNAVVHVRMGAQVTGPGMPHAHQTDPAPNAPGIHRSCLYGRGGTAQQDGVERWLVAAYQRPACLRQRPGDHAVWHRPQQTLWVFQLYVGLRRLILGTVPVRAGVRAVIRRLTVLAVIERAAKRLGATRCNIVHGLQRTGQHAVAKRRPVRGAMQVQELSDLSHHRARMSRLLASAPRCAVLTVRCV